MPRKGPRRILAATKLTAEGIAWIDQRALDEGLTIRNGEPNRSEMMRMMLAYASMHMPKGWKPREADRPRTDKETPVTLIDQLNAYAGDNVWQDVILPAGIDEEATEAIDPSGSSDRFVTEAGFIISRDETGQWGNAGQFAQ